MGLHSASIETYFEGGGNDASDSGPIGVKDAKGVDLMVRFSRRLDVGLFRFRSSLRGQQELTTTRNSLYCSLGPLEIDVPASRVEARSLRTCP